MWPCLTALALAHLPGPHCATHTTLVLRYLRLVECGYYPGHHIHHAAVVASNRSLEAVIGKQFVQLTYIPSFILSPNTAAVSHRKPAIAGTSSDSCGAQDSDKRKALYSVEYLTMLQRMVRWQWIMNCQVLQRILQCTTFGTLPSLWTGIAQSV
jgi:hypothetical protein